MASYRFPGVYASIRDQSGVVANNAITSAAYVGEAEYGPVFKPTLLSTLQDYNDKFGKLNSRYGYAGYSLAVAAESINQHYFVRVVPVGDPESSVRTNDATWGAAAVLVENSTAVAPVSTGYYYEEVQAAEEAREAGLDSSPLFTSTDYDSAFKVLTTNPNNRDFYITVADSTINENKAYAVTGATVLIPSNESGEENTTMVKLTLPYEPFKDAAVDDKIVVSKMTNEALNGTFVVNLVEKVGTTSVKISYVVDGDQTQATGGDANARVGMYPADNQTTFSVSVAEKVGRVITTLETFQYCTLYNAQDNYGNSTYIEDVINGSSEYIQVFVNPNHRKLDPDAIIIPKNVTNVELLGGKSGTWSSVADKYTALCDAWELFRDRSETSVSLLMNSGYSLKGNVSYQSKMLEIAEARRDCFCLFDVPMTETSYEDVVDWRRNVQGFNTYRGALSSPWIKTYDSVQGRANFVMCPSAYVAKIMGLYEPWQAPAGLNRGILTASTVSPTGLTQYYDETKGGNLYTDNQVNCIIKNAAAGYVNWGQRTLQAKPSALDRINVARTVIYIETTLRDAAKYHVFNNNTAYERMQITLQFNSFLDTVLSSEGIQAYKVVCDETNNTAQVIANNQLKVDIILWPTYCAEFIIITSTISGADTSVTVSTSSSN